MMKKKKEQPNTVLKIISKAALLTGVIVVFYKAPSLIAEKISYRKLKKKKISQNLSEE